MSTCTSSYDVLMRHWQEQEDNKDVERIYQELKQFYKNIVPRTRPPTRESILSTILKAREIAQANIKYQKIAEPQTKRRKTV
jgi:hypothetical protein